MSEQVVIKLSDVIAPAFYPVHYDIIDGLHENYDLYGGRGSTKSSFISVEIILGMMQDPNANAAVFRRRENTIGGSVFEQLFHTEAHTGAASSIGPSDHNKPIKFRGTPLKGQS